MKGRGHGSLSGAQSRGFTGGIRCRQSTTLSSSRPAALLLIIHLSIISIYVELI